MIIQQPIGYTLYMKFETGKVHRKLLLDDGRECLIRWATWDDLEQLTAYINELAQEDAFVFYSPVDKETLETESKFLSGALTDGSLGIGSFLVVEVDGKIIGTGGVRIDESGKSRTRHRTTFGISILDGYRGKGIGSAMMEISIDHARNFLENISLITLTAFADNHPAINLYKKYGFVEVGRLEKAYYRQEKYWDEISMALHLGEV